eukprot:3115758-Pyramimonas_sp.AAC.1
MERGSTRQSGDGAGVHPPIRRWSGGPLANQVTERKFAYRSGDRTGVIRRQSGRRSPGKRTRGVGPLGTWSETGAWRWVDKGGVGGLPGCWGRWAPNLE